MPTKYPRRRIDFQITKLERVKGQKNLYSFSFVPDPQRYEHRMIDGVDCLYDKLDNEVIGPYEQTMREIAASLRGAPVGMIRPKVADYGQYAGLRRAKIVGLLNNEEAGYERKDVSEDFLAQLAKDYEMRFVIVCIDLKGSTKMSQQLSPQENAKIIALFSQEMAALVDNYNGFILKYVGDGLIAYFPIQVYPGMDDSAVDGAIAMKHMIERHINPILEERKLPKLHFRIGIDSGEAIVKTIGDVSTKQHKDLIGLTINLAAKIQACAPEDGIVIGNATLRGLHFEKRKRFKNFNPAQWDYKLQPDAANPYPLHIYAS